METLNFTGSDQPLNLGEQRLSVSSALGSSFAELLESDHIELTPKEQNELKIIISEINSNKSNRKVIHSNSENVTASLLRIYNPNMIVGSKVDGTKEVLNEIGRQVGLPDTLSSADMIYSRLLSREKVAVVILNSDEGAQIKREFKRIPENGILILSK